MNGDVLACVINGVVACGACEFFIVDIVFDDINAADAKCRACLFEMIFIDGGTFESDVTDSGLTVFGD